jgi:DNA-binding transcriptional regulator YdaS (Cro superfamily)
MTLNEYLTEIKLGDADFGRLVGLSQSAINRLRRGESWPPAETARKILVATGGKVTANDFMRSTDDPKVREATVTAGGPAESRGVGGGVADLAPSDASNVENLAPPLSD